MASVADYGMILDSVKRIDPQEEALKKQQLSNLALNNDIAKQKFSKEQQNSAIDSVFRESIKKNTAVDPVTGQVKTNHDAVAADLANSGYGDKAAEYIDKQHAATYEKHKQSLGVLSQAAQGVMSQPEAARGQAYQSALAQIKGMGIDTNGAPEQYDPNFLTGVISAANDAKTNFEIQDKTSDNKLAREEFEYKKTHPTASQEGENVFLATPGGYVQANKRTGSTAVLKDESGNPYIPVGADVGLKRDLAGASATGKEQAENVVKAQQALPLVENNSDMIEKQIKEVLAHPGRDAATGAGALVPAIPGTDQGAFVSRLNQLKGDAFLQAFQSLKGAGAITDIEGKKAGEALSRMDRSLKKSEFDAAAKDFLEIVNHGRERARQEASGRTYQGGSGKNGMTPGIAPQGVTVSNW